MKLKGNMTLTKQQNLFHAFRAEEMSGGKGKLGRIYCPTGFSHFIDKCIELPSSPSVASYDGAESSCNTLDKTIFKPQGFIQFEALKAYFQSISLSNSFWIGKWEDIEKDVFKDQMQWTTDGQTATGDCVMAQQSDDFKWTRTDCGSSAASFCEAKSPKCPPGYYWIPEAGLESCYKFKSGTGVTVGTNMAQSISTANKACMDEGTSLAAPDTDDKLGAVAGWLTNNDIMLHGDWEDKGDTPRLFLGYRWFRQSEVKNGICPGCTWQDHYYSQFNPNYPAADVPLNISSIGPSKDQGCYFIQRKSTGGITIGKHWCYKWETYNEDTFLGALCEYRECRISATETCVFPFTFAGRTYDKCTTVGYGNEQVPAWCSLQTDENGTHIAGNEGLCPSTCPASKCPLGFWPHLSTCIQESASMLDDAQDTFENAENKCMEQGGRLYQPRSTKSLKGLEIKTPQFFLNSNSVKGILGWRSSMYTAIGMEADFTSGSAELFYTDGSKVPFGLSKDPEGLVWKSGFPTTTNSDTCVGWVEKDRIGNVQCDGYSSTGSTDLAYLCEAKPMTSTDTFKQCHFPFKEESSSPWRQSCLYDTDSKGKPYGWCATEVDDQGVMVGDRGLCDDERNTAYSGPDADNTCKIPFFYNGVWYENCTLYPHDQYWCPTKINPQTREQDGANNYGFCPGHLIPENEDCGENYDVVHDLCVRISPYPLTWNDAEAKCQSEGGHLLHIMSQEVQSGIQALIRKKQNLKDFFEADKWQNGLSSLTEKYWIGGMVLRQNDWRWVGNMMNFSKFSYWSNDMEGKGCTPNCIEIYALALDRVYNWEGYQKEMSLPYICASDCAVGYAWRQNAGRCVKIVNKDVGLKTQSEATLSCAQENGRLLSIDTCSQFEGLAKDLWLRSPSLTQNFWIGYYVYGFQEYFGQQRTSEPQTGQINSRGELGARPGGDGSCSTDLIQVTAAGSAVSSFATSTQGGYGKLVFVGDEDMKLAIEAFPDQDSVSTTSLCEKDNERTCPDGYTMFQESCYKFLENQDTAGAAHLQCQNEGAKVAIAPTMMHRKFLDILADTNNITSFWIGLRSHVNTTDSTEDNVFYDVDGNQYDGSTLPGAGDCTEFLHEQLQNKIQRTNCIKNNSILCETEQILHENLEFAIPEPKLLLPLDTLTGFQDLAKNIEEYSTQRIAFTYNPSPQNMLNSAAHFIGDSFIDLKLVDNYFKNGFSVSCWIYIDKIDNSQSQYIVDTRGPYQSSSDVFNKFQLYVEKNTETQLAAVLCNGPASSDDGSMEIGNCTTFKSSKATSIDEQKWTYVSFSYSTFNNKGTFVVNQIYGYQDGSSPMENKYFNYDSQQWLNIKSQGVGIEFRIGASKLNDKRFVGKISCFQVYDLGLKPSQLQHASKCYLDSSYKTVQLCPSGYTHFRGHCYMLSSSEEDFSNAEYGCLKKPSNNFNPVLAYPPDHWSLDFMSSLAQSQDLAEVWVGLDGRSVWSEDNFTMAARQWIASDGEERTDIKWKNSAPEEDTTKQCVFFNSAEQ